MNRVISSKERFFLLASSVSIQGKRYPLIDKVVKVNSSLSWQSALLKYSSHKTNNQSSKIKYLSSHCFCSSATAKQSDKNASSSISSPFAPPPSSSTSTVNLKENQRKSESNNVHEIKIDKRGLYSGLGKGEKLPEKMKLNDLGSFIKTLIRKVGPITVADFMDIALAHPELGYYMKAKTRKLSTSPEGTNNDGLKSTSFYRDQIDDSLDKEYRDKVQTTLHEKRNLNEKSDESSENEMDMQMDHVKIGKEGDFITAPEISQMFGELIGIWCIATWEKLGKPQSIQLVEMGPGKGTLMKDMIRTFQNFPEMYHCIKGIRFIETSDTLKSIQEEVILPLLKMDPSKSNLNSKDIDVSWHKSITDPNLPNDMPMLFVAQELFDALPAHQFEYTKLGWRERLVNIDEDEESAYNFTIKTAENPTVGSVYLEKSGLGGESPMIGSGLEISPIAMGLMKEIAIRLRDNTGSAALIIDYGEDFTQPDTLRGLKKHGMFYPLEDPGDVDLSVDVDFSLLKKVAENPGADQFNDVLPPNNDDSIQGLDTSKVEKNENNDESTGKVKCYGPMPQGLFLSAMGIETRLMSLLDQDSINDEQAMALYDSYRRLVDPEQMGRKYKVLACIHEDQKGDSENSTPPPAFENLDQIPKDYYYNN